MRVCAVAAAARAGGRGAKLGLGRRRRAGAGRRAVRARPGGGTLRSHREGRAAAGRHTPARRARLSGGGAGCARLRRRPGPWAPRPASLQVTSTAFGGARGRQPQEELRADCAGSGGLRACGPGQSEDPRFPASSVLSSRVSPGNLRRRPRRGERGGTPRRAGSGSRSGQPRRRPGAGSGRGALERRLASQASKKEFGSPCLRAGPHPASGGSPSAAAAGGDTRPRAESREDLARAFLGRERVHPGAQRNRGYAPAGRAELGCRDPRGDANPAVTLRRANDPSQMNPSNSRTGRCQVSDRLPGARPRPQLRGRKRWGALRSVPATPSASTPSPATCRDAWE